MFLREYFFFRLEVETSDGLPLKIVATQLKTNINGVNVAKLDISKDKWLWLSPKSVRSISATVDQDVPYQIRKFRPVTRLNTQIIDTSDDGVSFTEVEIKDDKTKHGHAAGTGWICAFYAPSNSSVTMMIKDVCGQLWGLNQSKWALVGTTYCRWY
ncbi:MAG: hypothetical protein IPJ13_08035 [Saprospiraceae bacterium]|nr:hypothetical protein [Saprospiraceae bacterium]